jgi:hypothetical protein
MTFLGGVVRAVWPDHGVQEAGILWQRIGMVVTDTRGSQESERVRKCRVENAMSLRRKDLSDAEVNKI